MDKRLSMFVPLSKVDVKRREVWGVLVEEVVDKSDEVFDYASSKPNFERWNSDFSKATEGKSVGNLRAMHKTIAAGKFISMEYDDVNKKVLVGAKVVDDGEWQKVVEGVYTGFSIGGSYQKRWHDPELNAMRYTATPSEGSLVDNPCMYGATFTVVKADGAEELIKFMGGANMDENVVATKLTANGISAEQLAEGVAKAFPAKGEAEDKKDEAAEGSDKEEAAESKDEAEGDGEEKAKAEVKEEVKDDEKTVAKKSVDMVELQKLHEAIGAVLGANCEVAKAADADLIKTAETAGALEKQVGGMADTLAKMSQGFEVVKTAHDSLQKAFGELKTENEALVSRVAQLEAQPASGGVVVTAVNKTVGGVGAEAQTLDKATLLKSMIEDTTDMIEKAALSKQLALLEMHKTHGNPIRFA